MIRPGLGIYGCYENNNYAELSFLDLVINRLLYIETLNQTKIPETNFKITCLYKIVVSVGTPTI